MKKIVFLLMCLCSMSAFAKDEITAEPLRCDTVLIADGRNADEIYSALKVWFAKNMRSANDVIQLDDKGSRHIIGKATIPMKVNNMTWGNLTGFIHFTIDVQAKDGRFRLKMYDYSHEATNRNPGWSEGIIYNGKRNPNISGLRKKQNSEMHKRALPLIIDQQAFTIVSMSDAVSAAQNANDDDW